MKHTYDPTVTVAKGATEGGIALVVSAAAAFFWPEANAAELGSVIAGVVAVVKMARNWYKNRKAK